MILEYYIPLGTNRTADFLAKNAQIFYKTCYVGYYISV